MTLANFIRLGKTPVLKLRLKMETSRGTMMGAAIFNSFIGMSFGPADLLSSSWSRIIITSAMLVSLKVKFSSTLLVRNDNGDMGVFGISSSTLRPTFIKKLLKALAI